MRVKRHYVLARKGFTWASGRALARYFRSYNYPIYVTEKLKFNIDVNWGNSLCQVAKLNAHIGTNKLLQLTTLKDYGIPTIEFYETNPPLEETLLARRRTHQAGTDIVLIKPGNHYQ